MGIYQNNCYLVKVEKGEIIIDPGVGAAEWIIDNVSNPVAILNTHGHFDHVWDNAKVKKELGIPIYCPRKDAFMLRNDPFGQGTPSSTPDYKVKEDEVIELGGVDIRFRHFPGHTPGNSVIEIEQHWFSGDFIFRHSIGRCDFPHSDTKEMIRSLERVIEIDDEYILHPGHGPSTTLKEERRYLPFWITELNRGI